MNNSGNETLNHQHLDNLYVTYNTVAPLAAVFINHHLS